MTKPTVTREQVRAIDEAAINRHHIAGLTLMENASRAVAAHAVAMLDGSAKNKSIVVICGGGNNGGDGFATARLLHEAGARVICIALRPLADYQGDAKANLDRCLAMNIDVAAASDSPINTLRNLEPRELIIDAAGGTGIASPVRPPLDRVIDWMNHQRAPVLSIDIPTGLDCDTGKPLGGAVEADATVTFVAMKAGFLKANAGRYTGRVIVADIGTPPELLNEMTTTNSEAKPFRGRSADLYDIFVDWPGRLGREMPLLRASLDRISARKVLDVGCGTGRHARALIDAGYDTHAADASADMLERAGKLIGDPARVHRWVLGEPAPSSLVAAAPFDAITCLGNMWPQLTEDAAIDAAARQCLALLRPGGLMLVGLKAIAVRRQSGNPYMPLLKRKHDGCDLFFVRFVDFDAADPNLCDFHMLVAGADLHTTNRIRVWTPSKLAEAFTAAGFADVSVSASLGDPKVEPTGEDVFVHAIKR